MLVLSRRPEQEILIGDEILVKVLHVDGQTVRLGITAPKEYSIHRREVYDQVQVERIERGLRGEEIGT